MHSHAQVLIKQVKTPVPTKRSQIKLPTKEESTHEVNELVKIIGPLPVWDYIKKAKELALTIERLDLMHLEVSPKILALNTEEAKNKIKKLRSDIQKVIKDCCLHFQNTAEKEPAAILVHMQATYQFITKADAYYAELHKSMENYETINQTVIKIQTDIKNLKTTINNVTECPLHQKKYEVFTKYYAEQRKQFEALWGVIEEEISNSYELFKIYNSPAQKGNEMSLMQEANTLIVKFMQQQRISNFIIGAEMELAYKPQVTKPTTASLTSTMKTLTIASAQPKQPTTPPLQIPTPTSKAATAQPATQHPAYTAKSGSPVIWKQPQTQNKSNNENTLNQQASTAPQNSVKYNTNQ